MVTSVRSLQTITGHALILLSDAPAESNLKNLLLEKTVIRFGEMTLFEFGFVTYVRSRQHEVTSPFCWGVNRSLWYCVSCFDVDFVFVYAL